MSDVMIRVEGLGKRYRLGAARAPYQTLRDQLARALSAPFRAWRRRGAGAEAPTFWALQDVSFEVKRGEVLGIIGRNGAGKSTLLKVLSRITEPTAGEADIGGRVGSLLEVGTGFHPELTGRENVFLNGAVLGMRRAEIARKFDDIVAFAEVEPFIDTPVKHYSSGMYMRLAFAVAAHLEPEVLIVDEVLAVGDAGFQKKCLGKMGEVAHQGRTVLFVSHQLAALSHLCTSTLVLRQGRLAFQGPVREGISFFQQELRQAGPAAGEGAHLLYRRPAEEPVGDLEGVVTAVELLDRDGGPKADVHTWDWLTFRIHFRVLRPTRNLHLMLQIADAHGTQLAVLTTSTHVKATDVLREDGYADCSIPRLPFAAGTYLLSVALCVPYQRVIALREDLAALTVQPADVYQCGIAPRAPHHLVAFEHDWQVYGAGSGEAG